MRLLILFSIALLLTVPGRAQERVRNVRIRTVDSSLLEVRYDLITVRPGDSVYVELYSRLRGALVIYPQFIRGDLGIRITAGPDRRIVWDALANGYLLDEEIQAKVFVKTNTMSEASAARPPAATSPPKTNSTQPPPPDAIKPAPAISVDSGAEKPASNTGPVQEGTPVLPSPRRFRYAGPAWALVSAVAPGIGNIFVQNPRAKVGFRPLLTVGYYGLLVYGVSERRKSQDAYATYQEQKNLTAGEPYYQLANESHHRYFLATRGAFVAAAADVLLTFLKGLRNEKEERALQAVTVRPGLQAGQPTAVLKYTF